MIVGTAGHIDHGKTALVRALTGVDTARSKEEKQRGMTIDLGFAYGTLPNGPVVGFVDVPGHEKFVHNMLAGAGGVDFAMLVVAADDGPMPQTLEHAAILNLLGLSRGVVALSKCDLASRERIAEVTGQIQALLRGTELAGYPIIPVSARTGAGIAELEFALAAAASASPAAEVNGNFRLAVDRCFTLAGTGTVITGTVFSGRVSCGDRLLVSPVGIEVRVRGIHAQNRPANTGERGQRCALNLAGPDFSKTDIARGDWVVAARAHAPTARIDARMRVLSGEARALAHWTSVHLHLGAAFATARVAILDGNAIAPGESARVQLVLDRSIGAFHGDRFIVREQSAQRTIGGGTVIDPFPPIRGRRTPARLAVLDAMQQVVPAAALRGLLPLCKDGVNLAEFARAYNLAPTEAGILYRNVVPVRLSLSGVEFGFTFERLAVLEDCVLQALRRYHERNPGRAGPTLMQVQLDCAGKLPLPLLSAVTEQMLGRRKIMRRGNAFCLPGHQPVISPVEQRLRESLLLALRSAHCRPPHVRELVSRAAANEKLVRMTLRSLAGEGELYRISEETYFARDAVWELALRTRSVLGQQPGGIASVVALREGLGIGRNLLIELLEFFDQRGFTLRMAEGRRIRNDPVEVFGIAATAHAAEQS